MTDILPVREKTQKKRERIMAELMTEIALGKDLSQLTKHDPNSKYPAYSTIRKWIKENEQFQKDWIDAKTLQAESEFEKSSEIYCKLITKKMDAPTAKVALEIIKWRTSRLNPRRYFDRILGAAEAEVQQMLNVRMPELERFFTQAKAEINTQLGKTH